jgi:excisionase family DNA binding protein
VDVTFNDQELDRLAALLAPRLQHLAPKLSEPWIGVREAAEYIGSKPQRIYDLIYLKKIPHGRDGRLPVFRRSELDRYLQGG